MVGLNDKTLLLLEDNVEFIDNAVSLFTMFVAKVCVAHTIKEACDLMRVRKSNNAIPILVLSGHKDEELLFKALHPLL